MTDRKRIKRFLEHSGWVVAPVSVSFLAAGEYNENFLVTDSAGANSVFRVNHGSQLGLADQIEYEFRVLKAVHASGVTPEPYRFDPALPGIGGGALLMEYLPGVPLDYARDWPAAAEVFARIHELPSGEARLVEQPEPVLDIARESLGLLTRFGDHPLREERKALLDYHAEVVRMGADTAPLFSGESPCIVNTEVNSHNFLIDGAYAYLVDWEKAVRSLRYQDLGHFMVPTTTLWRSEYVYDEDEKLGFLARYRELCGLDMGMDELREKTRILERTILLRGLSWCYMAYYEYTGSDRPLSSAYTFRKIRSYLGNIPWFLKSV
ncbi:MAG: phosphotransferase [Spirochaetota bacterium]